MFFRALRRFGTHIANPGTWVPETGHWSIVRRADQRWTVPGNVASKGSMQRSRSLDEPLVRLSRDLSDEFEIVIDMEDGHLGEFGGCSDEQVGYRHRPMVPPAGERNLHCDSAVLYRRREVLDGHVGNGRLPECCMKLFA